MRCAISGAVAAQFPCRAGGAAIGNVNVKFDGFGSVGAIELAGVFGATVHCAPVAVYQMVRPSINNNTTDNGNNHVLKILFTSPRDTMLGRLAK